MINVEARTPCITCGYLMPSWSFPTVVVNKRSIRVTGPSIFCGPLRDCPECGSPHVDEVRARYRPVPKSLADIAAYRARKWPELAAQPAAVGGAPW